MTPTETTIRSRSLGLTDPMHRVPAAAALFMTAPYPAESVAGSVPLADALAQLPVHDAELVGIHCDISWNADGFIILLLDPHWLPELEGVNSERWPTMLIRLPRVRSIDLSKHDDFSDVRRSVSDLSTSPGSVLLTDTLGGKLTVLYSGEPTALLLSAEGTPFDLPITREKEGRQGSTVAAVD